MYYEALFSLNMHDKPNLDDATRVATMEEGEVGRGLEVDGNFVNITVISEIPRQGWVELKDGNDVLLKEVAAPPSIDFGLWAFLKACIDAELRFNQSSTNNTGFFITADFLIAWADIKSSIKNIDNRNPLTDGIGPFQISSTDWGRFVASPLSSGFSPADREDGLAQIFGAAFLMGEEMTAISKAVGQRDKQKGDSTTTGPTGPFVPSYVDVLLAVMLGIDAAVAIRAAKMDDKGGASVNSLLASTFSPSNLQKLIEFRKTLLKDPGTGAVETVDGLLINADKLLNSELEKAFGLMRDNIPEDVTKSDDKAPWIDFAKAELNDWDSNLHNESTPQGRERVIQYFDAIKFKSHGTDPWCAAFVGFCLTKCGAPFNTKLPAGPASAASWAKWGDVSVPLGQPDVPTGAIVVLSPDSGTSKIGHVGFFSRYFDANTDLVEILGGNQSNTVRLSRFARSKIVGIRWFKGDEQRTNSNSDIVSVGGSATGTGSSLRKIAWGAVVSPEFKARICQISDILQCDPSHLMAAMAFETGETFSPKKTNKDSGATGLIQFIPKTAMNLGTSTNQLAEMSAETQLTYVQKYLQRYKGLMKSLSDVYMTILWPAAVGRPESTVIFKAPSNAYTQNKGLDINRDGSVTKGEAVSLVQKKLDRGLAAGRLG